MNLDTDFADDDGTPDVAAREALAAFAQERTHDSITALLDTFGPSRVLVPVVAVVDSVGEGAEKDSHMRQVDFTANDGRRALLAFSGTDSLQAWDPQARPIPRRAFIAAQGVLEADYDALIVDIAGPVPVAIDGAVLARIAVGPKRIEQLHAVLDQCCQKIAQLSGVLTAHHLRDSGGVRIVVEATAPSPELADAIPAVLGDSALAVLLDAPLAVEVLPRVTPVR